MDMIKIVMLGAPGVGKSSIVDRLTLGSFRESYEPTYDKRTRLFTMVINDRSYHVRINDIPAIPTFPADTLEEWIHYRNYGLFTADAYVLVFDVNTPETFKYLQRIRDQLVHVRSFIDQHHNNNSDLTGPGYSGPGFSGAPPPINIGCHHHHNILRLNLMNPPNDFAPFTTTNNNFSTVISSSDNANLTNLLTTKSHSSNNNNYNSVKNYDRNRSTNLGVSTKPNQKFDYNYVNKEGEYENIYNPVPICSGSSNPRVLLDSTTATIGEPNNQSLKKKRKLNNSPLNNLLPPVLAAAIMGCKNIKLIDNNANNKKTSHRDRRSDSNEITNESHNSKTNSSGETKFENNSNSNSPLFSGMFGKHFGSFFSGMMKKRTFKDMRKMRQGGIFDSNNGNKWDYGASSNSLLMQFTTTNMHKSSGGGSDMNKFKYKDRASAASTKGCNNPDESKAFIPLFTTNTTTLGINNNSKDDYDDINRSSNRKKGKRCKNSFNNFYRRDYESSTNFENNNTTSSSKVSLIHHASRGTIESEDGGPPEEIRKYSSILGDSSSFLSTTTHDSPYSKISLVPNMNNYKNIKLNPDTMDLSGIEDLTNNNRIQKRTKKYTKKEQQMSYHPLKLVPVRRHAASKKSSSTSIKHLVLKKTSQQELTKNFDNSVTINDPVTISTSSTIPPAFLSPIYSPSTAQCPEDEKVLKLDELVVAEDDCLARKEDQSQTNPEKEYIGCGSASNNLRLKPISTNINNNNNLTLPPSNIGIITGEDNVSSPMKRSHTITSNRLLSPFDAINMMGMGHIPPPRSLISAASFKSKLFKKPKNVTEENPHGRYPIIPNHSQKFIFDPKSGHEKSNLVYNYNYRNPSISSSTTVRQFSPHQHQVNSSITTNHLDVTQSNNNNNNNIFRPRLIPFLTTSILGGHRTDPSNFAIIVVGNKADILASTLGTAGYANEENAILTGAHSKFRLGKALVRYAVSRYSDPNNSSKKKTLFQDMMIVLGKDEKDTARQKDVLLHSSPETSRNLGNNRTEIEDYLYHNGYGGPPSINFPSNSHQSSNYRNYNASASINRRHASPLSSNNQRGGGGGSFRIPEQSSSASYRSRSYNPMGNYFSSKTANSSICTVQESIIGNGEPTTNLAAIEERYRMNNPENNNLPIPISNYPPSINIPLNSKFKSHNLDTIPAQNNNNLIVNTSDTFLQEEDPATLAKHKKAGRKGIAQLVRKTWKYPYLDQCSAKKDWQVTAIFAELVKAVIKCGAANAPAIATDPTDIMLLTTPSLTSALSRTQTYKGSGGMKYQLVRHSNEVRQKMSTKIKP